MFGKHRREHAQQLMKLEHQLDLIYTALLIKDPGTSKSAEAFEGLRKQVIAGATARQAHVAQLAEFDVALRRGASIDDLKMLSSQWLDQAGVTVVEDPRHTNVFESTVPDGVAVEVELPAYFVNSTNQVVRLGRLREQKVDEPESLELVITEEQSFEAEPTEVESIEAESADPEAAEPEAAEPEAAEPEAAEPVNKDEASEAN